MLAMYLFWYLVVANTTNTTKTTTTTTQDIYSPIQHRICMSSTNNISAASTIIMIKYQSIKQSNNQSINSSQTNKLKK